MTYVGRFAPSPTGPLHFGSLVAALGSWLDARANHGKWLVRIEDLDPPREISGSIEKILSTLTTHGLEWDDELLYQSLRLNAYDEALEQLQQSEYVYRCYCTRKDVRAQGGLHNQCLTTANNTSERSEFAWRLRVESNSPDFLDIFQGPTTIDIAQANEDFIVKRKDGLHAYMLAVVVDDIYQNVTHIIRGADLAPSSCQQHYLFNRLNYESPAFGHLPMAINDDGSKLSKQTHAPAIDDQIPIANIFAALAFLNQELPNTYHEFSTVSEILDWGVSHWDSRRFKGLMDKVV